jgi:CRP/FNR family transcriptional regulator, cyclic AMP receptor protein
VRRLRLSRDAKLDRLSGVQLFSACSKRDLARIAALTEEIDIPAGRVLIRRGDTGRQCFVIVDGTAKASLPGRKAARLGPGECFGELALLDRLPRSATVTAETDMHLLVLGSREFSTLLVDVPSVARRVLEAVAGRVRAAERARPQH